MLRYVFGKPRTGKTGFIIDEIVRARHSGGRLVLLTPEQHTLYAEKLLVAKTPEAAAVTAQVLSFQRLAYHLFARFGGVPGSFLDGPGKIMLLRRILSGIEGELAYYRKTAYRQGFMAGLSELISEFYRYGLAPRDIACMPGKNEKLNDIKLIYENYLNAIDGRYFSADGILDPIPEKLADSGMLDGARVWADGFHGFTPQESKVLETLIARAECVTVSLTVDGGGIRYPTVSESDFFYETKKTVNRLSAIADKAGARICEPVVLTKCRSFPEMEFFIENFCKRNPSVYKGECKNIGIVAAQGKRGEARAIADEALRLARSGLRFREIAVIAASASGGHENSMRILGQYGIPVFIDKRRGILANPLTELVRSAVGIAVSNWSSESVFRFLKTELAGVARDERDILENYALARGVKGFRWKSAWPGAPAEALSARDKLFAAYAPLGDMLAGIKKIPLRGINAAVTSMLEKLDAPVILRTRADALAARGENEEAQRFGQIWEKLCSVLASMTEILGEETVSVREYAEILDAGLSAADMAVIPPSADQMVAADVIRSRIPDVRAAIFTDADGDRLFCDTCGESLLSDEERLGFAAYGVELAPDTRRWLGYSRFLFYCAFSKPSEEMRIVCEGPALKGIAAALLRMFPDMPRRTETEAELPVLKAFVNRLPRELRLPANGGMPAIYGEAYRVLAETPETAGEMRKIEEYVREGAYRKDARLDKEALDLIYKKDVTTGITGLEKYGQCPMAYYLRYNLLARERDEYAVRRADVGSMYHSVLENVSALIASGGKDWREIPLEELDSLTDECADRLEPEIMEQMYSTAQNRYMLKRIKRICRRSVRALAHHIRSGLFEPFGSEMEFTAPITGIEVRLTKDRSLRLTGRVDRVDIMDSGGRRYIKIIDYKSGSMKFDLNDVYFGMQLQLILYLDALIKNGGGIFSSSHEMTPAGVFYFNIDDPIVNEPEDPSDTEGLIMKSFRMSGLVLDDMDMIGSMDVNIEGESDILPVYVRKTDGLPGANSSVISREGFGELREKVTEIARDMGIRMVSGDIRPYPYKKGGRTGCDYCEFGGVCGGDAVEGGMAYRKKGV